MKAKTSLPLFFSFCAVVTVLLFQNCSQSGFEATDLSSQSLSSNLGVKNSDEAMVGPNCPQYMMPPADSCPNGVIKIITNNQGCEMPACIANTTIECPQYQIPLCKSDETVVNHKKENGCTYPVCEKKKNECPIYNRPLCKDGKLVFETDQNGCTKPVCQQTEPAPSCPKPRELKCLVGESVQNYQDQRGCSYPVCVKVRSCPMNQPLEMLSCEPGTVRKIVPDANGCPIQKCENSPVCAAPMKPTCEQGQIAKLINYDNGCFGYKCVDAQVCPQYMLPPAGYCAKGETLEMVANENGCPKPTCVKHECPIVFPAPCQKGEELFRYEDSAGCSLFKCQPSKQCPVYNMPLCENGEVQNVIGQDGCKRPVCVKNPNPVCPQYQQILCPVGQVAGSSSDDRGCSVPICVPLSK